MLRPGGMAATAHRGGGRRVCGEVHHPGATGECAHLSKEAALLHSHGHLLAPSSHTWSEQGNALHFFRHGWSEPIRGRCDGDSAGEWVEICARPDGETGSRPSSWYCGEQVLGGDHNPHVRLIWLTCQASPANLSDAVGL